MNKFQWNSNRNSNILIQENAFESVVCEMAAMVSRPQCVNLLMSGDDLWHYRMSTSDQILAYCLMAPNHYMNQSWLIAYRPLRIYFNATGINIQAFSLNKLYLKMLASKFKPLWYDLNVVILMGATIQLSHGMILFTWHNTYLDTYSICYFLILWNLLSTVHVK